jgi:hypothetical protein
MALTAALIGKSNTTLNTSSGNNAVTCMMVCNYHASSTSNLTIYAVPNNGAGAAGTASNTNIIVKTLSIPAGETVTLDQEKLVLSGNDTIVALSSVAAALNIVISTLPV